MSTASTTAGAWKIGGSTNSRTAECRLGESPASAEAAEVLSAVTVIVAAVGLIPRPLIIVPVPSLAVTSSVRAAASQPAVSVGHTSGAALQIHTGSIPAAVHALALGRELAAIGLDVRARA